MHPSILYSRYVCTTKLGILRGRHHSYTTSRHHDTSAERSCPSGVTVFVIGYITDEIWHSVCCGIPCLDGWFLNREKLPKFMSTLSSFDIPLVWRHKSRNIQNTPAVYSCTPTHHPRTGIAEFLQYSQPDAATITVFTRIDIGMVLNDLTRGRNSKNKIFQCNDFPPAPPAPPPPVASQRSLVNDQSFSTNINIQPVTRFSIDVRSFWF